MTNGRRLAAALVLVALGFGPAHAGYGFHKYDCASVPDWFETNTGTLIAVAQFAAPFIKTGGEGGIVLHAMGLQVGGTKTAAGWTQGDANPKWVGVSGGVMHLLIGIGATPLGVLNGFLHLGCTELAEDTPSAPGSAPAAAP